MPTSSLHKTKTAYDLLLSHVKKTLIEGQQAIEVQKVRTYWQTGQHIHQYILKHSDRAEYGGEVVKLLARDLSLEDSTLYACVKFAKLYPKLPIFGGRRKFKWSHFRQLVKIPDEKLRKRLEIEIERNAWTSDELIARIKAQRLTTVIPPKGNLKAESKNTVIPEISYRGSISKPIIDLLKPLRGELYTYRIVQRPTLGTGEQGLLLDLGFGIFRNIDNRVFAQFKEGDIVISRPKDDAYKFSKKDGATDKDLFTFAAYVEKVVDGDTLKVRFDLGFDTWMRETLRLRGLDCPEMSTREGVAAKTFVQSYIKEADRIIVRSSRDDKYGRYLAEVYLPPPLLLKRGVGGVEDEKIPDEKEEIFLNNLLLEQGFAVRM